MTKNEARQKWCPMVRFDSGESSNYNAYDNKNGEQINEGHCIASDCMAWREERVTISKPQRDGGFTERSEITGGYCGLAGKP